MKTSTDAKRKDSQNEVTSHWILIRGLAREARHWGTFPGQLSEALNRQEGRVRVDALDLPGAGRFSEMRSPFSIAEITEFVRGKFLEIRHRQRLAGEKPASSTYMMAMSLGGMIAANWLERWPDDFRGCILVNTSFRGYSPVINRLSPGALRHMFDILRERGSVYERELRVLEMISNRPEIHAEIAREWERLHLDRPVSLENFTRQLIAAARFEPRLIAPPVPVLLLNSAKDRMVDASCSQVIAQRWNAELRCHPSAGHDLPLDDGPWVIEEIGRFIEQIRSRRN
jgi:pimeloyl-[acyl-carrier protein] methyl ester esterase